MSKKTETRPATGHINPFGLRMQPDLRERLENAASANGRSLNAEIAARLEESFDPVMHAFRATVDQHRADIAEAAARHGGTMQDEIAARLDTDYRGYGAQLTLNIEKDGRPSVQEVLQFIKDLEQEIPFEFNSLKVNVITTMPSSKPKARGFMK